MYQMKEMVGQNNSTEKLGASTVIPPAILPKFKSSPKFTLPKCAACHLAHAMKRNPGVINKAAILEKKQLYFEINMK